MQSGLEIKLVNMVSVYTHSIKAKEFGRTNLELLLVLLLLLFVVMLKK